METIHINGLDFEEIKKNFIEFLKKDQAYKDYNFEASGINSLLNIFAYNAHYIGFYVKMLLNESFIDSAMKRETLLSKAKLNGYIPKNVRSSRAKIKLSCAVEINQDPESKSVIIPRGSHFTGTNTNKDGRSFYVIDDVICYDREEYEGNGKQYVKYTSPEFLVYEGSLKKWRFIVDSRDAFQRFVIKDKSIDIDTLRINVYDDEFSTNKKEFILARDLFKITPSSNVFYVSTNEDGFYEIFFGNNQFGKKLDHGNLVEAVYISSSGESGNGCKSMVYVKPPQSDITRYTTAFFDIFDVKVIEPSHGGLGEETIEELRFNIPHHFRRQNRIVTESDFKSILLSEFRNIDSINVWGGEKNHIRKYGSVFICIKPKYGLKLTGSARREIEKILEKYSVIGMKPIIVDPDYLFLDVKIVVKFDPSKTSKSVGEIEKYVHLKAVEYGQNKLDRFDSGLSEVDFLDYIRKGEPSIIRIYSIKTMTKEMMLKYRDSTEHVIFFGNKIIPNSLKSSKFKYGKHNCEIRDEKGSLFILDENGKKVLEKPLGTIDYEKGIIKIIIDLDIVSEYDYDGILGKIKFTAKPELDDIETFENNILLFNTIEVKASYA